MTNPDFLSMAVADIVAVQPNLSEAAKPTVELLALQNFQRALAEAYRQHAEFLEGWIAERLHSIDHGLLDTEHRNRIRALFTIIGVGETTADLLMDSEFSTKPLAMAIPALSSLKG